MAKAAFIGAGAITAALMDGLIRSGMDPRDLAATNRSRPERLALLAERFGVVIGKKAEVLVGAPLWILAVKPADTKEAISESLPFLTPETIVVSVAAGVSLARLRAAIGDGPAIVRAMPNTPSQVGEGVTALSFEGDASFETRTEARELFGRVGMVLEVDEPRLDAVTALSGSGPAYVLHFLDALVEAGRLGGLDAPSARRLAVATIVGTGRMLGESPLTVQELLEKVVSPGGTTAAALGILRGKDVRGAVIEAVSAARRRSMELNEGLGGEGARRLGGDGA